MNIERFDKIRHSRSGFDCGNSTLNRYLKEQISQDIKKNLTVCYVLVDEVNLVKGYYTLNAHSLKREDVPKKYNARIPRHYDVPVILLGRLARDLPVKGKGAGGFLIVDALKKCKEVSEKFIGAIAVVVDPIDQDAVKFYEKVGFLKLQESSKMFLPMGTVNKLLEAIN